LNKFHGIGKKTIVVGGSEDMFYASGLSLAFSGFDLSRAIKEVKGTEIKEFLEEEIVDTR